jgi:hypothetical protein
VSCRPCRHRPAVAAKAQIAVVAMLVIVLSSCSGGGGEIAARGVGTISAAALVQRGLYLGPPGKLPTEVPRCSTAATPTTFVAGATVSSAAPLGAEQLAVRGDPADGKATVSARAAVATALANGAGFVGTVKAGSAVLVEMKDTSACVVATAWAIPETGLVELSCGPVSTDGAKTGSCEPQPSTTITFVDAMTGKFISAAGFGGDPATTPSSASATVQATGTVVGQIEACSGTGGPTAHSGGTVLALRGTTRGQQVGRQVVPTGGKYDFILPPGRYVIELPHYVGGNVGSEVTVLVQPGAVDHIDLPDDCK